MKKNAAFALWITCFCAGIVFSAEAAPQRITIIFSVDGVGYEQLKTIDPDFVRTHDVRGIVPPFPSYTFPSHVTLATGVEPETHAVLNNEPHREERAAGFPTKEDRNFASRIKAEPLWTGWKERSGVHTEVFDWPCSYGPWNGKHADRSETKFVVKSFPEIADVLMKRLEDWDKKDDFLFMSWTPGLDQVGHVSGPLSTEVREAWKTLVRDKENLHSRIAQFGEAMKAQGREMRISFVTVADHGMLAITKTVHPKGLIDAFADAPTSIEWKEASPVVYFHKDVPADFEKRIADLKIGMKIKTISDRFYGVRAMGSLPPGAIFSQETSGPLSRKGMHGYLPSDSKDMKASLWVDRWENGGWIKEPKRAFPRLSAIKRSTEFRRALEQDLGYGK